MYSALMKTKGSRHLEEDGFPHTNCPAPSLAFICTVMNRASAK